MHTGFPFFETKYNSPYIGVWARLGTVGSGVVTSLFGILVLFSISFLEFFFSFELSLTDFFITLSFIMAFGKQKIGIVGDTDFIISERIDYNSNFFFDSNT